MPAPGRPPATRLAVMAAGYVVIALAALVLGGIIQIHATDTRHVAPDAIATENRSRPGELAALGAIPADAHINDGLAQPIGPEHPAPWTDAAVTPDGRALVIRLLATCTSPWGIATQESEDAVIVTVNVVDRPPDLGDTHTRTNHIACPPDVKFARLYLQAPLAGRLVLDAAGLRFRPLARLG